MQFGLHLCRREIITAEELVAALEVQTRRLVKIGQIALEEGVLSARDIFDVLRAQHRLPHMRFGELAVEMGLMTRNDLMRLLMIQAERKLSLADILVWQSVLTRGEADEELEAYRLKQQQPRGAELKTSVIRAPHVLAIEREAAESGLAT
jgi:hypothetical protein